MFFENKFRPSPVYPSGHLTVKIILSAREKSTFVEVESYKFRWYFKANNLTKADGGRATNYEIGFERVVMMFRILSVSLSWAVGLTQWIVYLHIFIFWQMQLYMSWYIISFFGFIFAS